MKLLLKNKNLILIELSKKSECHQKQQREQDPHGNNPRADQLASPLHLRIKIFSLFTHSFAISSHSQRVLSPKKDFVYIFPGEDFRKFSLCRREKNVLHSDLGHMALYGEKRRNSREHLAAKKLFHPRCGHFPFFLHLEQMGRKM